MNAGELLEHAFTKASTMGYTQTQVLILIKLQKENRPMRITELAAAAKTYRQSATRAIEAFTDGEVIVTRDQPLRPFVHLKNPGKMALMELLSVKP